MSAGDWKDMYYAAERGDIGTVRYHLRNGIDPNYQHPEFLTTALIGAVKNNQLDVVSYLLECGARPEIKAEFEGIDAYQAARQVNDPAMLEILGIEQDLSSSLWQKCKRWMGF